MGRARVASRMLTKISRKITSTNLAVGSLSHKVVLKKSKIGISEGRTREDGKGGDSLRWYPIFGKGVRGMSKSPHIGRRMVCQIPILIDHLQRHWMIQVKSFGVLIFNKLTLVASLKVHGYSCKGRQTWALFLGKTFIHPKRKFIILKKGRLKTNV